MAHLINAATDKVPVFGNDASISIGTAPAVTMPWIVTQLSVTTAGGVVELANSDGMTVARTYYNRASTTGKSYARQLTMTVVVVATDEAAAKTANVAKLPGTVMTITCGTHPDANDTWEIQSMDATGSNTEHATFSITAMRAVSAS